MLILCASAQKAVAGDFVNGKNAHFPQNVRNFVTSCVTLAPREYVCFRDFVIANSRYQILTRLNANFLLYGSWDLFCFLRSAEYRSA
jgi:hypothetical protein